MLLYLSQFFHICPPASKPPFLSPKQSSHCCSCPWVMHMCSLPALFPILYFTSPWLFCNYQFVLLYPFTSFTHPADALPSGNQQNVLVFMIPFLFFFLKILFLDSVVNRYVFFCHFVHIFDLLKEDP